MTRRVLAIDQGTTGSTALVFSEDGRIVGRGYREITQHYPQPGWVEHDPEEIWQASREVMVEAWAQAESKAESQALPPVEHRGPAALGITNQRETTVVWDRATGEPVYPAIVWQSRQTAGLCRDLIAAGHEPLLRRKTGLVVDAYFSGTKIAWILDRDADLRRRAEAGELAFGTIDSWLLWRLTGGRVHVTEPTNASRTLLFDLRSRSWDPELCEILRVPMAVLPEVWPSSGLFGETVVLEGAAGRIPAGVPIAGIAGDQQAALFGQGCFEAGQAKNTYGTGCFALLHAGEDLPQRPSDLGGLLTTVVCDQRGGPAYGLEGSVFIAGAALQWLRDELGILSEAGESEALARSLEDNGGVYLVPAFAGLGAPYWDMDARGAVVGLTRGSGRAHLARAALESIAFQSYDVMEAMNSAIRASGGVPLQELRVDGGASSNDFLMQLQADLLQVPVDRPAVVETTAQGAAFLAGLGVGVWSGPEELQALRRRDRRFEPAMDEARRRRLLDGWHQAVDRVRTQKA